VSSEHALLYAMYQSPQVLYNLMEPKLLSDFGDNDHQIITIITKIMYLHYYIWTVPTLPDTLFQQMAMYTYDDLCKKGLELDWYK
jgi:hypothetical protein